MPEVSIKLIIVGDSNVGKTSILLQYIEEKYSLDHVPTLGIEYNIKTFDYKNYQIKLQIWDTAGQERFRSVTNNFFHCADGILFVYDISDHRSFEGVKSWIQEANEIGKDFQGLLVGNKCDLNKREVSKDELNNFCKENKIEYIEVSAKDNINIQETFKKMVELLFRDKNETEILKQFGESSSALSVKTKGKKKGNNNTYKSDKEKCC